MALLMLSGLWHQTQESGHPLIKTTVRIPGPSSKELPLISRIKGSTGDETPVSGFMAPCGNRQKFFQGQRLLIEPWMTTWITVTAFAKRVNP